MAQKKTIAAGIVLLAVMVAGALIYVLVDHYVTGGTQAAAVVTTQSDPTAVASDTDGTPAVPTTTQDAAGTSTTISLPSGASTDAAGSYSSDTLSITITKVSTGSGADTLTYFVADVWLASGTDLQAGIATTSRGVADTSDIADTYGAIFAVNGDYFGARNDGIIIRNGEILRDEPVRTGLALYHDGHMEVFDEAQTSAQQLLDQGVWNTYSFGPALLIDGQIPDNVGYYEVESNPQHPVQGRNPRTGIGITDDGHFVFIVVDGRNTGYSKGVTIEESAEIFQELGCTTAYNLDGGGSSTMYLKGEVVNNPSNKNGERATSDILFVG